MNMRSLVVGFMVPLAFCIGSQAAELKVLSAFGMQSVMEDLAPKFESATGHRLAMSFATGGATVKRIQEGETTDVVITVRPGIDTLVKDGMASSANVTVLA